MLRKSLVASSVLLCFSAFADNIECININENTSVSVELRVGNDFNNCFYIGTVASGGVNFVVYSINEAKNRISVFDVASQPYLISEKSSDAEGANGLKLPNGGNKLALKVTPADKLYSNKNIKITRMKVNNVTQVLVQFDDLPSDAPEPIEPNCQYINGELVCIYEN